MLVSLILHGSESARGGAGALLENCERRDGRHQPQAARRQASAGSVREPHPSTERGAGRRTAHADAAREEVAEAPQAREATSMQTSVTELVAEREQRASPGRAVSGCGTGAASAEHGLELADEMKRRHRHLPRDLPMDSGRSTSRSMSLARHRR